MKRMMLLIWSVSDLEPSLVQIKPASDVSRAMTEVRRRVLIILFHNVCQCEDWMLPAWSKTVTTRHLSQLKVNNKLTAQTDLEHSWEMVHQCIIQLGPN